MTQRLLPAAKVLALIGFVLLLFCTYGLRSEVLKLNRIRFSADEAIAADELRMRLSFSSSGRLVYQEVFEDFIPALAPVPSRKNMQEQTLLVGGDGVVWEYQR